MTNAVSKNVIIFLISTLLFTQILSIIYTGSYAWDDGAITLAFSKTFALSSEFALTPVSERVEGTSTLLYMLLMSFFYKLLTPDFHSFILISQITSLFFLTISCITIAKYLIKYAFTTEQALLITLLSAFYPAFYMEIQNGMEMTLFMFLIVAFSYSYTFNRKYLLFIIPLLLLTRFESIFYLGIILGLAFFCDKKYSKENAVLLLLTLTTFLILTVFRYHYFGSFAPNTVYAKLSPPYASIGITGKIKGAIEFISVFLPFILLSSYLLFTKRKGLKNFNNINLFIIFSFGAFSFLTSKNWGYNGRMSLACYPIFVIFLSSHLLPRNSKNHFSTLVIVIFLTFIANGNTLAHTIITASKGGYYQGLPVPKILTKRFPEKHTGVTPENNRTTALTIEIIRKTLGIDHIKFLVPDVGGTSLCSTRIEILDSALLTNKKLAREGYDQFATYLEETNPEIIETHSLWSRISQIYNLIYFQEEYKQAVVENTYLSLRNDVFQQLVDSCSMRYINLSEIDASSIRDLNPFDFEYLHSKQEQLPLFDCPP